MTAFPAGADAPGPRPGQPTGLPAEPLEGARALTAELADRMNLPENTSGLLFAGRGDTHIGPAAQVAAALALTDIAASLRVLSGRDGGNSPHGGT